MIINYESTAWKVQCELCGKYFKTKGILRRHVESVHGSSKHPCDMCIYEAPDKYSLKKHKHALHKKVKNREDDNLCYVLWGITQKSLPFNGQPQAY